MYQHRRLFRALTAAMTLGFTSPTHGQDAAPAVAPPPAPPVAKPAIAPAVEKPESIDVHADRLRQGKRALSTVQGISPTSLKIIARTSVDGPDRFVTVDFQGQIVMFSPDGVSFRRIKLEGTSAVGVQIEDLKCVTLNGTPHWLAATDRLRDARVTVGLYSMEGKLVAKQVLPTKPNEYPRVQVEFADVTGDGRPEIVGTLHKSSGLKGIENLKEIGNIEDAEDAMEGYSTFLFVLSDKAEMLAMKRIETKFPGALHVCSPTREGEAPIILLQGDSRLNRYTYQQLSAPEAPIVNPQAPAGVTPGEPEGAGAGAGVPMPSSPVEKPGE